MFLFLKKGFDLLEFDDIKVEADDNTIVPQQQQQQQQFVCKQEQPQIKMEEVEEEEIKSINTATSTTTITIKKADEPVTGEEYDAEVDALKNQKSDQLCRLYLWYFLLELLEMEGTENIICWTDKDTLEFKIHDAKRLAVMWGSMHGRENMTYAKFSRALRYHYKKGVLQKVG